MLLTAPGAKDVELSKLKIAVGGSALPHSMARAALARGIDVFAGYGQSESCPILSMSHLKTQQVAGRSEAEVDQRVVAGRPLPLVDLRIVDADMADVPHDGKTPGEIVVRAPWLTMGYLNNSETSEQLWAGGYLHTGDVATWSADGNVHIVDRLKDIIKSGGEWISSIDLEDIISEKRGVRRAAVIGVRDEKWGERPLALVVLDPEVAGEVDDEAIRAHVRSYVDRGIISKFAIPERIMMVKDLPLTTVGKIDKKVLRERYQREQAA